MPPAFLGRCSGDAVAGSHPPRRMIRSPSPHRPLRVAVVGGGTAGLAAALSLREQLDAEVLILEAGAKVGGNNQSFDGVPLFFSCLRSASGSDALLKQLKSLHLEPTPCDALNIGLKDKRGSTTAANGPPSEKKSNVAGKSTVNNDHEKQLQQLSPPDTGGQGVGGGLGDQWRRRSRISMMTSHHYYATAPCCKSEGPTTGLSSCPPPPQTRTLLRPTTTAKRTSPSAGSSTHDEKEEVMDNSSDVASDSTVVPDSDTASNTSAEDESVSEGVQQQLEVYKGAAWKGMRRGGPGSYDAAAAPRDAAQNLQSRSPPTLSEEIFRPPSYGLQALSFFQESSPHFLREMFTSAFVEAGAFAAMTTERERQSPHVALAAGMNYFFSSADGFDLDTMHQYYAKNPLTYYYSIEHGQNHLLVERMVERLAQEGKTRVLCNARCTLVRPGEHSQSKQALVQWIEQDDDLSTKKPPREKEELFDAVLVCVPPHIAKNIVDCKAATDLCHNFQRVTAHSVVHTDHSVKATGRTECGGQDNHALTYEVSASGAWAMHIDCNRFYNMGGKTENIVSVWYDPDEGPLIDERLVKGRFTAELSKVDATRCCDHSTMVNGRPKERMAAQLKNSLMSVGTASSGGKKLTNADFRDDVRTYHEKGLGVYLCASYWGYEQWTQDAFSMADEVVAMIVHRVRKHKLPLASKSHEKIAQPCETKAQGYLAGLAAAMASATELLSGEVEASE